MVRFSRIISGSGSTISSLSKARCRSSSKSETEKASCWVFGAGIGWFSTFVGFTVALYVFLLAKNVTKPSGSTAVWLERAMLILGKKVERKIRHRRGEKRGQTAGSVR